jgi:hypothetical protein
MFTAASFACNAVSWACCAAQCAGQVCCSIGSCFGCSKPSALAAKVLYIVIFLLSATLAVVMRYYAEPSLASWVPEITRACGADLASCFGAQAVYRISLALAAFFALMCGLTTLAPITHYGGWLVKLLLFLLFLGLTLLVPNSNMLVYAEAARVFSVVFLVSQVVLLIDLVYNAHYALLKKMDARDDELAAAGWSPGLLSNCWKVLYMVKAGGLFVGSIVVLSLLFHWFGNACPLNNFFIAQTLAVGLALTALSLSPLCNRGLLPPATVLAYNTFLTYSAITNNPDTACNLFARTENQSQASVIIGLIVAVVSVTYMAVSSASKMEAAVTLDAPRAVKVESPLGGAGAAKDWAGPQQGASYQEGATHGAGALADEEAGGDSARPAHAAPVAAAADDAPASSRWEAPTFHATMFLAGCYVAMMASNWGSPSATASPGQPELSTASMWARMGSQFLTEAVFLCALARGSDAPSLGRASFTPHHPPTHTSQGPSLPRSSARGATLPVATAAPARKDTVIFSRFTRGARCAATLRTPLPPRPSFQGPCGSGGCLGAPPASAAPPKAPPARPPLRGRTASRSPRAAAPRGCRRRRRAGKIREPEARKKKRQNPSRGRRAGS